MYVCSALEGLPACEWSWKSDCVCLRCVCACAQMCVCVCACARMRFYGARSCEVVTVAKLWGSLGYALNVLHCNLNSLASTDAHVLIMHFPFPMIPFCRGQISSMSLINYDPQFLLTQSVQSLLVSSSLQLPSPPTSCKLCHGTSDIPPVTCSQWFMDLSGRGSVSYLSLRIHWNYLNLLISFIFRSFLMLKHYFCLGIQVLF